MLLYAFMQFSLKTNSAFKELLSRMINNIKTDFLVIKKRARRQTNPTNQKTKNDQTQVIISL